MDGEIAFAKIIFLDRDEGGSRHHQDFHSKHVAIITELTLTASFFCRRVGREITANKMSS